MIPSWLVRVSAVVVAMLPLAALAITSRLQPDSRGLGTHQQLGLPPCSMRVMLGIRCPGCGMTTSWAYFTQGRLRASAETNLAGFLLAWFAIGVAWLAARTALTGSIPSIRTQQIGTSAALAIGAVAVVQWVIRLVTA